MSVDSSCNHNSVTSGKVSMIWNRRDFVVSLVLQAFAQFDAEGDGTVDAENMLEALKNSSGANLQGELGHIIRQLQACSLVPGKAVI